MIAKIFGLNDDGDWAIEGTIELQDGQWAADTIGANRILNSTFHWNDRAYTKADGEEFLKILPNVVNGSYVAVRLEDDAPQAYAKPRPTVKEAYHSVPKLLRILNERKREEAKKG